MVSDEEWFDADFADFLEGHTAYMNGEYEIALTKLTPLEKKGNANAQFVLAKIYDEGNKDVPKNCKKALKLCCLSAKGGNPFAQTALGTMYKNGDCVEQDDKKAVMWYRRAAKGGDIDAQFYLGEMYEVGRGVKQDDYCAYMWFSIGATPRKDDTNPFIDESSKWRDTIAKRMTPEQLDKAKEILRERRKQNDKR